MSRAVILMLALLLALGLTSCAPARRPRIMSATATMYETHPQGSSCRGVKTLLPGHETTIGLDACVVQIVLEPAPSAAWVKENVRVSGGGVPITPYRFGGDVAVDLPPGKAGDIVRITLASGLVPEQDSGAGATYALARSPEPRARLELWADGGVWREARPGDTIAARPLKARLVLTKPVNRHEMEGAIREALPGDTSLAWQGDRTVVFEAARPPAAIRLSLCGVTDTEDGLCVLGGVPVVFTGPAPQLYSLRSGSGEPTPLRSLPANLTAARIDGSGTRLLAGFVIERADWPYAPTSIAFLDVAGGDGVTREYAGDLLFWRGPGTDVLAGVARWSVGEDGTLRDGWTLFAHDGEVRQRADLPEARAWHCSLSPDGKTLAGLHFNRGRDDLTQTHLALINFETGRVRQIDDFSVTYLPLSEFFTREIAPPVWSADGRYIAGISDGRTGCGLRVADLETGKVETVATIAEPGYSSTSALSLSPDGQWWLLDNLLVSFDGTQVRHIATDDLRQGRHFWSGDSRYVAVCRDWSRVTVVPLDGSAPLVMRGPYMGCGWDDSGIFYYVTWPDAEHRYDDPWR